MNQAAAPPPDSPAASGPSLPPGPRSPALGQAATWLFRPIRLLERCSERFGDDFTIRFPSIAPYVFISDPAAIEQIFRGSPDSLDAGEGTLILKPLLGNHSVILADGAPHRRQRKLLVPPFHGERMRAYGESMRRVADASIERWPIGRPFPVRPWMQGITLEIILRTVFGLQDDDVRSKMREKIDVLLRFCSNPLVLMFINTHGNIRFQRLHRLLGRLSPLRRYERLRAAVDRMLYDEIGRRRAAGPAAAEDVLSLLLVARDDEGKRLGDEELRDEMITLLVAGNETTATALSWVLYRLGRHPAVMRKVREELRRVVGAGPVKPDNARELHYLSATIKETLRLHPVLPVMVRQLREPMRLGRLHLPAGTIVTPNVYLAHRRPDVWEDPERFMPERFLNGSPKNHHFFPFGGGHRRCLGMAFAYYEMAIVVAQTLLRITYRVRPGYRAGFVRRSITFAPSGDMPLVVDTRD